MAVDRVVVVGTSVGGIRTAQALRTEGFTGEVLVVGEESAVPYDKPPLSKEILTGARVAADISLLRGTGPGEEFTLRQGAAAVALDPGRREIRLSDGDRIGYDALVIATGVRPRTLPSEAPESVRTVRELRDGTELAARLATGEPVVVVGGGFVGAEVAASAAALGCQVTVVEAAPAPFSRVLGPRVGALLTALHEAHGVRALTGVAVRGVTARAGGGAVVTLEDGRLLEAGTVVAGIGCAPDTRWLAGSGTPVDDGIVTDEYCAVPGLDQVYAIGDIARWYDRRTATHRRVEHWTNAVEQAGLVARNLTRPADRGHHATTPYFWSDQYGVKIQMVGRTSPGDTVEILRCAIPAGERDVALYSRHGRLTAAVSFGWPRASVVARQAWPKGTEVAEVRSRLAELAGGVTTVGAPAALPG